MSEGCLILLAAGCRLVFCLSSKFVTIVYCNRFVELVCIVFVRLFLLNSLSRLSLVIRLMYEVSVCL